jgi:lipoprotein-anchoring transpeptidase ErfK/SrfK
MNTTSVRLAISALSVVLSCGSAAWAQPLALTEPTEYPHAVFRQALPSERATPQYESTARSKEAADEIPAHLRRQVVGYTGREAPGTIVIDTPNTYLYYVLGNGRAIRYGIGVGREGFTWSGVQSIVRKAEWPDWYPPTEMIARQPYLPRMMAGGAGNPLGARAMYLGNTAYRIHGTNAPDTIGKRVSSGCIRLTNEDIEDLYEHVTIGTKVVVLTNLPARASGLAGRSPSIPISVRAAATDGSDAHRIY